MKTLSYITWGIIAIYSIIAIIALIGHLRHNSGMDAAGRGMAAGFLVVGIAFLIGLILLNLLPFQFTKILTLLIALSPFLYTVYSRFNNSLINFQQDTGSYYFESESLRPLAAAIAGHNLQVVKELAPKVRADINEIGKKQETLLQMAIVENQYNMIWEGELQKDNPNLMQMIEVLLQNGADPNVHHPDKEPVLIYVSMFVSKPLLELLLKYKADPNGRNKDGMPVAANFIHKRDSNSFDRVTTILDHGANPNIVFNYYGGDGTWSLLSMAANQQQWEICELLLERGADPNYEPTAPHAKTLDYWLNYYQTHYAQTEDGKFPEDFKSLLQKRKEYQ